LRRILLALLILATPLSLRAQDQTAVIKREAQKCAAALIAGDYDGVVAYTHSRVVALMGGKEAMIAAMKKGTASMRADGYAFLEATIGRPGTPKHAGAWLTSLVPEHIVIKVPGGKLLQDSTMLGISEDNGKTWVFVDIGVVSKEQFAQIFPELEGQVTPQPNPKPVFIPDAGVHPA
jgi:hypothetical protein